MYLGHMDGAGPLNWKVLRLSLAASTSSSLGAICAKSS